jgi:hypothetical protein
VVPLTLAQSCVSLRVLRAVFVMPRLGRFAPGHLRMLQVSQHVVVVMRSGPRFFCSERGHCRSEHPYQRSPAGLRQQLVNAAAPRLTATTCGNSALSSYCPRSANGPGPPPTLTTIRLRQFRRYGGALLATLCDPTPIFSCHRCSYSVAFLKDEVELCARPPSRENEFRSGCCLRNTW